MFYGNFKWLENEHIKHLTKQQLVRIVTIMYFSGGRTKYTKLELALEILNYQQNNNRFLLWNNDSKKIWINENVDIWKYINK